MDDRRQQFPLKELLDCRLAGIEVIDLVTFLERETGKVYLDMLIPSWMIFGDGFRRDVMRRYSERAFDMLAELRAAAALVADHVADRARDQARRGSSRARASTASPAWVMRGQMFRVLKFRSMRVDAEKDGQARWADDQRRSRHARRPLHPQGAHRRAAAARSMCCAGDMSFVGPRPERPEFVEPAGGDHSLLRRAPRREAGHHRLGAALLSLRRFRAGRGREAAVRPVLREEPQPAVRHPDPAADRGSDPASARAHASLESARTSSQARHMEATE